MEHSEEQFDMKTFASHRKADVGLVLVGIIFGTFLDWGVLEIIFFAVFIWSFLGPIAARLLALPAFFFLFFSPALLIMGRADRAEEFAIYAYYFLAMAVIRGIIEIRSEPAEKTPNNS